MRLLDHKEIFEHTPLLLKFAAKYVWWLAPLEAAEHPQRVIAQVMNIGDFEDALTLQKTLGPAILRDIILNAEAGQFTPRSWHFWHYRLRMAQPLQVPPLPQRRIS